MNVVKIDNKDKLDSFIGYSEHSRFLQSWGWGEFLAKINNTGAFRLGIEEEDGKLLAAATLIKKKIFGKLNYLYCPHGPVLSPEAGRRNSEIASALWAEIGKVGRKEKALFLRFEPGQNSDIQGRDFIAKYRVRRTIDIQPARTLILDITPDKKELLKKMHPKTRYNIRLAEKKGVMVRQGNVADFGRFWQLMRETVKRDRFRLHPQDHYRNMLTVAGLRLYVAEYRGAVIAANLLAFFGDTVTYLHGASANAERPVMAPYWLQWRVIEEARAAGYRYYDFYGIDRERWPGVTRFKLGFGGCEYEYPGTFDLPFRWLGYHAYLFARKLRRSL